ncbi:MAG TPA: DUF4125 family protein [Syntrophorhabdaceae bacterium]|nr:DUF4125 family protein [Syntrophorhabdaceae bacterium]
MTREEIIASIIAIEWDMFQAVPNIGGAAPCQDERQTFEIMRLSQAASWSQAALRSYLHDLTQAQRQDRNLMTEKYARMMKSTSPQEYARIDHLIPATSPSALLLIEKISAIILDWEGELAKKYPRLLERGRPLRSSHDSHLVTSLETYLKSELATYSLKTLELYYEHLAEEQSKHINGSEITLALTVKQYGFQSLEEANRKLEA